MFLLLISTILYVLSSIAGFSFLGVSFAAATILSSCGRFGLITPTFDLSATTLLSNVGLRLMMLEIGTHMNVKQLRQFKKEVGRLSAGTVVAGLLCSMILYKFWHLSIYYSLITGFSTVVSSTVVCSAILLENNRLINKYGQITLIGTVVQDLLGIILITIISVHDIRNLIAYLPILVLFYFIQRMTKKNMHKEHDGANMENVGMDTFIPFLLILHIVTEYFELIHISSELIFFIVGIIINNFYTDAVLSICICLYKPLIGLMIITNIQMIDLDILYDQFPRIALTFLVMHFIKFISFYLALLSQKMRASDSIRISIALISNSELIFFILPRLILTPEVRTMFAFSTALSMFITPILFNSIENFINSARLTTIGVAQQSLRHYLNNFEKNYFIVIGITKYSELLIESLSSRALSAVVLDTDSKKVLESNNENYFVLDAMMRDSFKNINFNQVTEIYICINSWQRKIAIVKNIRFFSKKTKIRLFCFDSDEIRLSENYDNVSTVLIDDSTVGLKLDSILNDHNSIVY